MLIEKTIIEIILRIETFKDTSYVIPLTDFIYNSFKCLKYYQRKIISINTNKDLKLMMENYAVNTLKDMISIEHDQKVMFNI